MGRPMTAAQVDLPVQANDSDDEGAPEEVTLTSGRESARLQLSEERRTRQQVARVEKDRRRKRSSTVQIVEGKGQAEHQADEQGEDQAKEDQQHVRHVGGGGANDVEATTAVESEPAAAPSRAAGDDGDDDVEHGSDDDLLPDSVIAAVAARPRETSADAQPSSTVAPSNAPRRKRKKNTIAGPAPSKQGPFQVVVLPSSSLPQPSSGSQASGAFAREQFFGARVTRSAVMLQSKRELLNGPALASTSR
eukprot:jgi/Chlat1/6734/Chrsp50S06476